jgi:hypothetical protein
MDQLRTPATIKSALAPEPCRSGAIPSEYSAHLCAAGRKQRAARVLRAGRRARGRAPPGLNLCRSNELASHAEIGEACPRY